jgi:hypothetical protein
MSLAISVQNVSKLYRLGEISRGQLLADIHRWWLRRKVRKTGKEDSPTEAEPQEKGDFWANPGLIRRCTQMDADGEKDRQTHAGNRGRHDGA